MEHVAKKNILDDDIFKAAYYNNYVAQIKSNSEFQKLEYIAKLTNLQIVFGFSKSKIGFTTQYEIGFEVCNAGGSLVSVPQTSQLYDYLFNLISYFPVVSYSKLNKRLVVSEIDEKELCNDCKLFSEYLRDEYKPDL